MEIVKISASWCPACLITNPSFDSVIKEYPDYVIKEYDYDLDEEVVKKYKIGNILPVIILFKDGMELNRLIGEKNKKEIKEFLENNR